MSLHGIPKDQLCHHNPHRIMLVMWAAAELALVLVVVVVAVQGVVVRRNGRTSTPC